jgi:hypothetical protein
MKCLKNILKCDCGNCSETKAAIIARVRRLEEAGKVPKGRTDRLVALYYGKRN